MPTFEFELVPFAEASGEMEAERGRGKRSGAAGQRGGRRAAAGRTRPAPARRLAPYYPFFQPYYGGVVWPYDGAPPPASAPVFDDGGDPDSDSGSDSDQGPQGELHNSGCACRQCRQAGANPFTDEQEMDLAMELLSATSEAELEQFLGKLWQGVKKAGSLVGKIAKPFAGAIKSLAKTALPFVGGALGSFIPIPGVGTALGTALGGALSGALEMELEAMNEQEQEFEVARRVVRMAGSAARMAAQADPDADPEETVRRALLAAARQQAPQGLAMEGGAAFESEEETGDTVTQQIRSGIRDENQLTNRIFFQRHPERGGQKISAQERQLAEEWLEIRNRVVRPALRAAGIVQIDVRPYRTLLPLLNRYRGNIPLEFLLGWIAVESGGNIGSTTSLDERGYFQVHPGESSALHFDHTRLSTDPEYSVQKGIELAQYRASKAIKLGFPAGSELAWTVSKLLHWLPLGVQHIVALMRSKNFQPKTWTELRQFVLDHRNTLLARLNARVGSGWDPATGIANVDKVLLRGRAIAAALGVSGTGP